MISREAANSGTTGYNTTCMRMRNVRAAGSNIEKICRIVVDVIALFAEEQLLFFISSSFFFFISLLTALSNATRTILGGFASVESGALWSIAPLSVFRGLFMDRGRHRVVHRACS